VPRVQLSDFEDGSVLALMVRARRCAAGSDCRIGEAAADGGVTLPAGPGAPSVAAAAAAAATLGLSQASSSCGMGGGEVPGSRCTCATESANAVAAAIETCDVTAREDGWRQWLREPCWGDCGCVTVEDMERTCCRDVPALGSETDTPLDPAWSVLGGEAPAMGATTRRTEIVFPLPGYCCCVMDCSRSCSGSTSDFSSNKILLPCGSVR